jgi:phosphoglycerate dehydrogenase-like enzyme
MATNVLIVNHDAQEFVTPLAKAFPEVEFVASDDDAAAMHVADADVIMSRGRWLTRELVQRSRRLKWFQCFITGVDHLLPVLAGSDVLLTNARGIHGPQMSEMAILHMLALSREVPQLVRNQAGHVPERIVPKLLENRTVVILGVGAIAEHTARICKAFGMTTVGVSRTPRSIEGFDRMRPRSELLDAAAEADFLLLLLPHTPENDGVIGEAVFKAMKPTAYLINVARGGVVDEPALIKALQAGEIAGAGLDVFSAWPLPKTSPLWDMKNVFITPFVGGQCDQYVRQALTIVEPNLRHFLAGRLDRMINVVKA